MKQLIKQRHDILALLYNARIEETKHQKGFIAINDVKDALGDCEFNLGVLVELNHIDRHGYKVRITGHGVLSCEKG